MDFELSKPQKLLQKTVHEFLSRECSTERVRELMATETAMDDELWSGIADQGWTSLTLPEDYEGMGLGVVDLAAVSEVMGQFCLPGPFISTVWASSLIAASGNDDQAGRYLEKIADGDLRATVAYLEASADWDLGAVACEATEDGGGYRLDGKKLFVNDAGCVSPPCSPRGDSAGLLLWVARLGDDVAVFSIEAGSEGMSVEPMAAIDQTRKIYAVNCEGVTVGADALLARGDAAATALRRSMREATVAVCAELVGGMQWVLATAVEYAKSRKQFGKPIGVFQAVQHHCADILMHLESARSATYYAAWSVSQDEDDADHMISVAKAYCSDAARQVGNHGIQVHGGIGFTWEHDLQLYYKRAKSSELLFGDATYHRELIARRVIDR